MVSALDTGQAHWKSQGFAMPLATSGAVTAAFLSSGPEENAHAAGRG